MDVTEEDKDIQLQKFAADLIADFDRSLPNYLRKPDGSPRTRVRVWEGHRLNSTVRDSQLRITSPFLESSQF